MGGVLLCTLLSWYSLQTCSVLSLSEECVGQALLRPTHKAFTCVLLLQSGAQCKSLATSSGNSPFATAQIVSSLTVILEHASTYSTRHGKQHKSRVLFHSFPSGPPSTSQSEAQHHQSRDLFRVLSILFLLKEVRGAKNRRRA